jgi:DNA mismatch repair protein MutL
MELTHTEIRILPEFIANQIAAGEVVQRPESVVKELVENALDAGATAIAVMVRGAGKQLIHVVDDGKGMQKEDLPLTIKRHATSKIRTADDLHRITTLGFRGEALASIASVAHVEIRSRRRESISDRHEASVGENITASAANVPASIGWKLLSEPLQEPRLEPCAMEYGTQVFVRNLFYNVPARRKFLRSDLTEFRHIADTMLRFALGNPTVRFILYDDDALVYDLPASAGQDALHRRIADALTERFAESLLPVHVQELINGSTVTITGFVGQPSFAKKTRSEQFLYLNGRSINSRQLSHAVLSAYEHLIDQSSYPPYVLFLQMDAERVDVNVHPQKHEVKFDDDRTVYAAVRRAVSAVVMQGNFAPQASFRGSLHGASEMPHTVGSAEGTRRERLGLLPTTTQHVERYNAEQYRDNSDRDAEYSKLQRQEEQQSADELDAPLVNRRTGEIIETQVHRMPDFRERHERRLTPAEARGYSSLFASEVISEDTNAFDSTARHDARHDRAQAPKQQQLQQQPLQMLWQLHRKYIFMQTRHGLLVIDQHAAHERILYERALKAMNEGFAYGQELLFPVSVHLTPSEATLVKEVQDELHRLGFVINLIEHENGSRAEIQSVPGDVRTGAEEQALKELLEQYREYNEVRHTDARDNLAASFGCRSAIRAGDALTLQEMRRLVDDLYATSMPYACPHGRPIIIELPLDEFDRRFGRTPQ